MHISWSWAQPSSASPRPLRSPSQKNAPGAAVAIGSFDGLHLGHQALIRRIQTVGRSQGLVPTVCSFQPHPRKLFSPQQAPGLILPLRDKLDALARAGLGRTHFLRFNEAMASLSPQEFVQQILVRVLQSRLVVVGEDFRFGHRRAGDIGLLTSLGEQHGFQTEAVSEVVEGGLKVSSSRVRQALADGDLGLVRRLLGRPYTLSGRVRYGQQLGRKLGFPTLNLAMPDDLVAIGIFAVRVHGLSRQPLPGVASLGRRPTVESNGRLLLEVHVLDWDGLAYGQAVQVEMVERLRGEKTFDHLDAMIEQMHQDLAQARQRLQP